MIVYSDGTYSKFLSEFAEPMLRKFKKEKIILKKMFEQVMSSQVKNLHMTQLSQDHQRDHFLYAYRDFVSARVDA